MPWEIWYSGVLGEKVLNLSDMFGFQRSFKQPHIEHHLHVPTKSGLYRQIVATLVCFVCVCVGAVCTHNNLQSP